MFVFVCVWLRLCVLCSVVMFCVVWSCGMVLRLVVVFVSIVGFVFGVLLCGVVLCGVVFVCWVCLGLSCFGFGSFELLCVVWCLLLSCIGVLFSLCWCSCM